MGKCWDWFNVRSSSLTFSNHGLIISRVYHFSHSCCYYQMRVLVSEPLAEISILHTHSPVRILNRLFSLAVIKFVSKLLDLSSIHWFSARRLLLLASILWFDRTAVRYRNSSPSLNHWNMICYITEHLLIWCFDRLWGGLYNSCFFLRGGQEAYHPRVF